MSAGEQISEPQSVDDVVTGIAELAERGSKVTIGDVLDRFGKRSFGPVMMVLALIELTPAGGIPGVPTILATLIALIAMQMLLGREHIWLPRWIERRSAPSAKLKKATGTLHSVAQKVDSVAHSRLEAFASGFGLRVAAAIIIVLCLTVPPFEVVPFASTGPMLAIDLICLAIMVRDGLAMLVAWILAGLGVLGVVSYSIASYPTGVLGFPF